MEFGDDLFASFEAPKRRPPETATPTPTKKQKTDDETVDVTEEHQPQQQQQQQHEQHEQQEQQDETPISPPASKLDQQIDEFAERYQEQEVRKNLELPGCWGEVCFPPNYDVDAYLKIKHAVPITPAKEYPFTLDPFQKQAVACVERAESVLVSAHTSAGKTVVAEYAIALALRDGGRVIYTSPIKALSNQKYRELNEEFGDVGLMTGDITINPNAGCLVMTTEILRNMMYRGSELMREISWVIFDEVHYMRDRARGVVWEETIILLPEKVHCAFLSATIPNATEFACWIAKLKNQPCNVVYTDFRPTPLQHYIFPSGGDGLYLVVDDKGNFREKNFQQALSIMEENSSTSAETQGGVKGRKQKGKGKKKGGGGGGSDISKIVRLVMERNYHPAIVFSFSKRDVEANALDMSKLDFCDVDEKQVIGEIFSNAMDSLSEDDQTLPQVENLLPLLRRGIGIHHGGLLPILKEVVEILFQEGLIKVLFATETFAMGLNMPAKTVIFTAINKFDGEKFRTISSGEYIQMSGRAGRRGLDDRGVVICMMDEEIDPPVAKEMMQGSANRLDSSFYVGYNMLLNLLRLETASPEMLMVNSFYQYQAIRKSPELLKQLDTIQDEKTKITLKQPTEIAEFFSLKTQLANTTQKAREIINLPIYVLPFLNPGRLCKVECDGVDWGWGVILNFQKKNIPTVLVNTPTITGLATHASASKDEKSYSFKNKKVQEMTSVYVVDVMLHCQITRDKKTKQSVPRPMSIDEEGDLETIPVLLSMISCLNTPRLFIPKDLRSKAAKTEMKKKLKEIHRRFPNNTIPQLSAKDDMKVEDETFFKLHNRIQSLEDRVSEHKIKSLLSVEELNEEYEKYQQHAALDAKREVVKAELKANQSSLSLKSTLKHMKRVLRRLEFTSSNDVIELKGRVACEISTCDELLATELLFSGFFVDLEPPQIVALVSCLVCDEKSEEKITLKEDLGAPLRQLQEKARTVANVIKDAKIPIEVEDYVAKFAPHMMDIVYAWCKGAKFSEICKMTDVFEGSIIRVMRRLEELLRQFADASKVLGNDNLESKFRIGIASLKRDIVFAASLYL